MNSGIKPYILCLGHILKAFTFDNIKNGINGYINEF